MTGTGNAEIRDLALHPKQGKATFQHMTQFAVESADAKDVTIFGHT